MSELNRLDLHGLTWSEACEAFIGFFNDAVLRANGAHAGNLEVVHGYGSHGQGGTLRTRLRAFLEKHQDCLEFRLGEEIARNPGSTIVTPLKLLPVTSELLMEHIWNYCVNPKPMTKITGKFRSGGGVAVKQAIDALMKSKRLDIVHKGAVKLCKAV